MPQDKKKLIFLVLLYKHNVAISNSTNRFAFYNQFIIKNLKFPKNELTFFVLFRIFRLSPISIRLVLKSPLLIIPLPVIRLIVAIIFLIIKARISLLVIAILIFLLFALLPVSAHKLPFFGSTVIVPTVIVVTRFLIVPISVLILVLLLLPLSAIILIIIIVPFVGCILFHSAVVEIGVIATRTRFELFSSRGQGGPAHVRNRRPTPLKVLRISIAKCVVCVVSRIHEVALVRAVVWLVVVAVEKRTLTALVLVRRRVLVRTQVVVF